MLIKSITPKTPNHIISNLQREAKENLKFKGNDKPQTSLYK